MISSLPAPATAPTRHQLPASSARVAMIGAGQLARMTQQAALDLGIELRLLAAHPSDAGTISSSATVFGDPAKLDDLRAVSAGCDAVTFDHERIPPAHLRRLEQEEVPLRPTASAKLVAQDKLHARELFSSLGFPVPAFEPVTDAAGLDAAAQKLGLPLVLKARYGGYDGRGVEVVTDLDDGRAVLARGGEWVAEEHVAIERELAQLVARTLDGAAVSYPLVETVQRNGICHEIRAPAPVSDELAERARRLSTRIAEAIGGAGVIAVELFLSGGELIVNELALRPHNSGHFTIEGCETSQFENHLRAVLGWPLGRTTLRAPAVVTLNVLAQRAPDPLQRVAAALAVPGAHLHLYGKPLRQGRKVGHVTALGESCEQAHAIAARARALLGAEPEQ